MKVAELIRSLSCLPLDAEVAYIWDGEPRSAVEVVWLAKDGRVVLSVYDEVIYSDSARPVGAPSPEEVRWSPQLNVRSAITE